MPNSALLSIGQVAERTGLAVSAIRYYEDEKLVFPIRAASGHRHFRRSDIRRLSFVRIAQGLGFTIAEIREIIDIYKGPPGEPGQLEMMMTRVAEKREQLNQKRKDIDDTLAELDNVDEACLARLAELRVGT